MTRLHFLITAFVIGAIEVDLVLLLFAPSARPVSIWLQKTWLGSPLNVFLLSFFVGGCLGYSQPTHPLSMATATTEQLSRMTAVFCTSLITLLILWDATMVYLGGIDASVSRWMQDTAYDSPIACGGCGFLCGHFFNYVNKYHR